MSKYKAKNKVVHLVLVLLFGFWGAIYTWKKDFLWLVIGLPTMLVVNLLWNIILGVSYMTARFSPAWTPLFIYLIIILFRDKDFYENYYEN